MTAAGIDKGKFTGHSSTRAAVSSKAKDRDMPSDVILSTAGWASANTFYKFYHKPILDQVTLADTVLKL